MHALEAAAALVGTSAIAIIKVHNATPGTCTGTGIDRAVARQFAADTGANLSLHDLSVRNLCATYDHFIDREFITINRIYFPTHITY